jgi:multidrug efflux pump subunit AcrA (membrane-fusion protein)
MLNVLKGKRFRNRTLTGIVVIAVLLLAGRTFLSARANTATMDVEGKVVSVVAAETVETSGSLEAQSFVSPTWETNGVVEDVYVKAGDMAKSVAMLMKLNGTGVPSNVFSAQADLVVTLKK